MPVEGAGLQDDVRRPVGHVEQPAIDHVQRQLAVVVVGVQEESQAGILLVLGADRTAALLANRSQCRQENAQQKGDNGDHHQQFNECKSSFSIHDSTSGKENLLYSFRNGESTINKLRQATLY